MHNVRDPVSCMAVSATLLLVCGAQIFTLELLNSRVYVGSQRPSPSSCPATQTTHMQCTRKYLLPPMTASDSHENENFILQSEERLIWPLPALHPVGRVLIVDATWCGTTSL